MALNKPYGRVSKNKQIAQLQNIQKQTACSNHAGKRIHTIELI